MTKVAALRAAFLTLSLFAAINQYANLYYSMYKLYDKSVWSSHVGIVDLHGDNGVNVATMSTPERFQHGNVDDPSRRTESSTTIESKKDLSDRLLYDSFTNTTFQPTSACIMFSDDNAWLPEWLAYHYYAAGLRTLVVYIDITSLSGPQTILNRWTPYFDNIVIWDRRGFAAINATGTTNVTEKLIFRQSNFYKDCALFLRNQSLPNQWTFFHDTDEFVTIDLDVVSDATERMAEPSSILRLLYDDRFNFAQNVTKNVATSVGNDNNSSLVVHTETKTVRLPCHLLNRYLVTAENSTQEEIDEYLPLELKSAKLNTILYRNIHYKRRYSGVFKSLVDIRHILSNETIGIHQVSSSLCHTKKGGRNSMIIKHYLGPWEMYNRENDDRKDKLRSRKKWKRRSIGGTWQPSVIQPWLHGFEGHIGIDAAQYLLQGAGGRNILLV